MNGGEGMVAVVHGLQGSGLAVTLLDSGRQFTLVPENYTNSTHPAPRTNVSRTTASQCASNTARRESGTQATDGRYTSTYKMMHCHSTPTSPPEQVTEFPPQRAEICPGHGNFIVGGHGSGESYCNPMRRTEFRGAMCWPDRGSVFSPRPSLQPDSFATSLRKYPNICQDRSSEIVERLISFTQAKNSCRNNRNASPPRNIESNMSNQTFCLDAKSSRNTSAEKLRKGYQPEIVIRPKRFEESPTREISMYPQDPYEVEALESWRKPTFFKTSDGKYLSDVSRKVREGIRSLSVHPDNRPERLSPRERIDSSNGKRRALPQLSIDTVNMEIQATVQVTSREIMTLPRIIPSQITIAIPLTPTTSKTQEKSEERNLDALNFTREHSIHQITQIIQTKLSLVDIHVQTVRSAVEFRVRKKYKRKSKIRSRSEEKAQIIELMKYRNAGGLKQSSLKSRSLRLYNKNKPRDIYVKLINNFESKIFNVDISGNRNYTSDRYHLSFARIFLADVTQHKMEDEHALGEILKDWINMIPLKVTNKCSAKREKKYIKYDFLNYLKRFVSIPPENIREDKLKSDILSRLKLIPLEVKADKTVILNRLAEILINKIIPIGRKRWVVDVNNKSRNELQDFNKSTLKLQNPSEKVLQDFMTKYTILFLQNFGLKLQESLIKDIEDELLDIFTTSLISMSNVDDDYVKRDIAQLVHNYGLSEQQAYNFAQILIKQFKETLMNDKRAHNDRSKTLVVLPNLCHRSVPNESDFTMKTDEDIDLSLTHYINELCRHINEWLNDLHIQIPQSNENEKQEAVTDLAKDIVERHKYLKLHPCNEIADEAEIEHLKYQIFKWINKFIGEDNLEPVQRAPDLLNRIKSIPVTVLSRQQENPCKNPNQFFNSKTTLDKSPEFDTIDNGNEKLSFCDNFMYQSEIIHDNKDLSIREPIIDDGSNKKESYEKSNSITLNDVVENPNKFNVISTLFASTFEQCCPNRNEFSNANVFNVETKNNDQLEAEYEQFVKYWVQKIPMNETDFEEETILEKARLGIHNGLWKVVSKLNCDPATYYNRFLYEDLLDDAIDDLLNCLPQSSELKSQRHLLKVEFIEKTISINDQIKENEEASFKNKLIQNITTNVRKQEITDDGDDSIKLHEDLQIINLVENYLLSTKFKNEDNVTSAIYRKKLLKEVEDFVHDLKKNHTKELKDIDVTTYETDMINILNKVPLPSVNSLSQEADNVLLGIEIEKWYNDLPVISNSDYTEQYRRRRQRDILAKKIKNIDSKNGMDDTESALRNEISKFLEKTPLEEGESFNINFMVDELVNRLKNKTKYNKSRNTNRVEFHVPDSYDEFRKNISFSSSFIETPNKSLMLQDVINKSVQETQCNETNSGRQLSDNSPTPIQINKDDDHNSSIKQTRVVIQEPPSYRIFEEERPLSSSFKESSNDQWFSLQNSHSDVSTQTQNIKMHTLPPYIDTEKDDTAQMYNKSNMKSKDITDSYRHPHYYFPSDTQEVKKYRGIFDESHITDSSGNKDYHENIDFKNYPSTSQTGTSPYQLKNSDIPYTRNVSKVREVNKQIFSNEGDSSSLKCSVECQTVNKTNYGNQVTTELNNSLQKNKISEATNTLTDNTSVSHQAMFETIPQHARNPISPSDQSKRRTRLALQEKDGVKIKLNYDSDEDDDIRCRCIERYFKYRQKLKRFPCEDFDRLPPCLPVLYPYPYFI